MSIVGPIFYISRPSNSSSSNLKLDTMAGSSLDQNPPNADRHITAGDSDWLWAVFAIMVLSTLGIIFLSFAVSIMCS